MTSEEQQNDGAGTGERGKRPVVLGTVVSNKMNATIVVRRDRRVKHPLYGKYVERSSRLYAHDAENTARLGDEVEIIQTRPLSKLKRWRLVRVVRRAAGGGKGVSS